MILLQYIILQIADIPPHLKKFNYLKESQVEIVDKKNEKNWHKLLKTIYTLKCVTGRLNTKTVVSNLQNLVLCDIYVQIINENDTFTYKVSNINENKQTKMMTKNFPFSQFMGIINGTQPKTWTIEWNLLYGVNLTFSYFYLPNLHINCAIESVEVENKGYRRKFCGILSQFSLFFNNHKVLSFEASLLIRLPLVIYYNVSSGAK